MPQLWGCAGALAILMIQLALGWWFRLGRGIRDFLSPRMPEVMSSETLTWAVRLRGWCGWALALWAGNRWFQEAGDWSDWIDGSLQSALEHVLVIPVLLCLGFVVLPLIAARGERRSIVRGLVAPARTLAVSVVLVVLAVAGTWLVPQLLDGADAPSTVEGEQIAVALLLGIGGLLLMLAFLGAVSAAFLYGVPAILRHMFRARDAHPAYPAVLTVVLSLYSLAIGLARAVDAQWESPFPLWVQLLFLVGGPVGVAVTSFLELWMLRTRCGVTLRRAYWRHA